MGPNSELRFLSVKNCEFFYILLATELCWGNPEYWCLKMELTGTLPCFYAVTASRFFEAYVECHVGMGGNLFKLGSKEEEEEGV